jgi:hypothetical protein
MAWGNPDLDMTAQMNPMWARWLDILKEQAGGKTMKLAGGPSAPGSNQLTGQAVMPAQVHDPRKNPMGPHGFLGAYGGDEGDIYGIRDNQFASTNPSLDALTRLGKKR